MKKIIFIGAILLILVLSTAVWLKYGRPELAGDSTGLFVKDAQPLKVTPQLSVRETSKLIGAAGGALEIKLKDGAQFQLNLPKNSLLNTEAVAMRQIKSVGNLAPEWKFVAGVEIFPDGAALANNGELTINLPSAAAGEGGKLVAFSYSGAGDDFYFYPAVIKDGTAIFKLSGFSGYGVINVGESPLAPPAPSTIAKQAKQLIANILRESGDGQGGMTADQLSRIKNILRVWYNVDVRVVLAEAQDNDNLLLTAIHGFLSWWQSTQIFGLDGDFATEINRSLSDIGAALDKAIQRAVKKCVSGKETAQIDRLTRLYNLAEALRMFGLVDKDNSAVKDAIGKCANFELKIRSTITDPQTKSAVEVEGNASINFFNGNDLSGAGLITTKRYVNIGHACVQKKPDNYQIKILNTKLAADQNSKEIVLLLDLGEWSDDDDTGRTYLSAFNDDCGGDLCQENRASLARDLPLAYWDCSFYQGSEKIYLLDYDWVWGGYFLGLHADEMAVPLTPAGGGSSIFRIADWEYVGSPAVYARKAYQRVKNLSAPGVNAGSLKEDTVLELIHTPKA